MDDVSLVCVTCVSHITHLFHSYTGCSPIDSMTPCLHVFIHYPDQADDFGCLLQYSLSAFERYNKKIKNLVGNATHAMASLKTALLRDAGTLS